MSGLFSALAQGDFTSLLVLQPTPGQFRFRLAREWDACLDFGRFTHDFHRGLLPCAAPEVLGDGRARQRLEELGGAAGLAGLLTGMQQGGHRAVRLETHAKLAVHVTTYLHSFRVGRNNGAHGLYAGGLRRHAPSTGEAVVFQDGLNLSRAMSYKNAAAGLPFGGCKLTAHCEDFHPATFGDSPSAAELERLGYLAWVIDSGNLVTGPDMGFAPELIDALRRHFTGHMVCGPGARLGHTGAPTARGVFRAMQAAAEERWGSNGLRDRVVAIQGLGSVGSVLARFAHEAGARLRLGDIDAEREQALLEALPGSQRFDAHEFPYVKCDVLAPCAFGGLFDEASITRLECQLIYGGANNQLRASSPEAEVALAERLAARDILTQPDWTYTMGGVLTGFEEYLHPEPSIERVEQRIDLVCGQGTRELLQRARAAGRSPTAQAYVDISPRVS
ncbi:MAG: Glu/Leu/Phe/Val dehydrogenase [Polyangiaceae bacterium]|nr:Glu/Leu/Phe/Val dehydrogenase [Polyangiaceae bacterium]